MDVLCTLVITAFLSAPVREDLRELLFRVIHPFRPCTRCGPAPTWNTPSSFFRSACCLVSCIVFRWNSTVDAARAQARSGTPPHDRERFQKIVFLGCA